MKLIFAPAKPDQRRDNCQIPNDRRGIGKEKFAMAVENAETPGRQHEQSGAGKKDSDKLRRQFPCGGIKTRSEQSDEERCRQDTNENND
jgi:hypothetical protein